MADILYQAMVNQPARSFESRAIRKALSILLSNRKISQVFRAGRRYRQTNLSKLTLAYLNEASNLSKSNRIQAQIGFNITHNVNFGGAELIDYLVEKLQIFSTDFDWKTILCSAGLCLANIWYNFDRPATVMMSIAQFIMNLKLSTSLIEAATEFFRSIYEKVQEALPKIWKSMKTGFTSVKQRIRGQINDTEDEPLPFSIDLSPILPLVGGAASGLLTLAVLKQLPGGDKFQTNFDRFSKIGGVIKSYGDIAKVGNEFFRSLFDNFCYYVFGVERPVMDEWKNINEWISEVNSLITPGFERDLKNNEIMMNKLETLHKRGLNIIRLLDLLKIPMTERQAVIQCIMFLNRARETASSCGAGQTKPRVAPAIIHFYGASGVGKSTTLWSLIGELQAALGVTKESDLHEKTYFRRPGGKFWDGYDSGMNIVVCDDFGALKDSKGAPNEEFLEAIHMSNTAFWQLNMAELSEKRSTFFQAKCVLWTSNRSKFAVESLTNAEAVTRRVDLKIRQRPHPNFATTDRQNGVEVLILDKDKVNQAILEHGSAAMLGCVLFDVIDKNCPNDTVIEPNLSFWEMAELCVAKMNKTISHFEDFNKVLATHVGEAIDRCKDGVWKAPAKSAFDPNTFVALPSLSVPRAERPSREILQAVSNPKVLKVLESIAKAEEAAKRIGAQINMPTYDSFKNLMGFTRVHCPIGSKPTRPIAVQLGDISEEDKLRLANIVRSECFLLEPEQEQSFLDCYQAAEDGWFYLPDSERTDETFINLFHQAEIAINQHFDISCSQLCLKCKVNGLKQRLVNRLTLAKQDVDLFVQRKFSMTPTMFYTIMGVSTAILTFTGWMIYRKIFNRVKTMSFEAYAVDKTKAKASKRIEGGYSTDTTKAKKGNKIESYDTDKTKAKSVRKIEAIDYTNACEHGNVVGLCLICEPNLMDYFPEGVKAQAITDQNAAEVVNVLYKNMYKLEYFENGVWTHAMNLLIVKGRLALVNRHLLVYKDKSLWRIRNQSFGDGIEFHLGKCNYYYAPDDSSTTYGWRDAMMIELPLNVHQHKDITGKFMDSDDFSRFKQLKQVAVIGHIPDHRDSIRQYFASDVEADDSEFEIENNKGDVIVTVRSLIKYNIQTAPGDCGAVLVAFDKNFNNKIFGIHCGGVEAQRFQGFGTPVSRSFLKHLEANVSMDHVSSSMHPQIECNDQMDVTHETDSSGSWIWKCVLPFVGNFYQVGEADKPVHQSSETKIVKSPVYGQIQTPTMAPAVLRTQRKPDGTVIDPMANARIKASPISKPIDTQILKECAYNFYQKINTSNSDKIVLTYEQGIMGIEQDPCFPPMKRSTSPGYGWDAKGKGKGKTHWLGENENYNTTNEEVLAKFNALLDSCKKGERPSTIWVDTLKDERRTLDKVAACKTRLFSCGEMAFTILFRMYFAGFIAHMTRNKIDFESCVGTNCYSLEWTKIAKLLKTVGGNILAGDFANYDGTLHPDLLWECCDLINNWYDGTPEETLIRVALWSEIVNSVHIVGNKFYMWNHSQPSGCPMTTILNCVYHSISARYVYVVCARKSMPAMSGLDNFTKYVRHVNYGDDDVWSIGSEIIDWFNQVTITEAYKCLGMTYTDEAKTGNVVPFRRLDEINFLKREFRWDEEQARYRAPLALATIREMPMWNHGSLDQYENTAAILQDAVRELAQHPKNVFDQELPAFERAATTVRKFSPVYYKTFEQYQFEEFIKLLE